MTGGSSFFVDSNVLLYSVDPVDSVKRERCIEWLRALWLAGAGRLSWQVLHEFYANAVKKMEMDADGARRVVEGLAYWRPVDTSLGLIQQAWQWEDQAGVSHWDALILAGAQRSGARYLLSEDFQNQRQYDSVQILSPFDQAPADFGL